MTKITDTDKLRALLPHWIEHNAEHAAEFRNWAANARATGLGHVAEQVESAAIRLSAANEALQAALQALGESGQG